MPTLAVFQPYLGSAMIYKLIFSHCQRYIMCGVQLNDIFKMNQIIIFETYFLWKDYNLFCLKDFLRIPVKVLLVGTVLVTWIWFIILVLQTQKYMDVLQTQKYMDGQIPLCTVNLNSYGQ